MQNESYMYSEIPADKNYVQKKKPEEYKMLTAGGGAVYLRATLHSSAFSAFLP